MPKFKVSFPLLFDAEFNIEIDKTDIKVAWNIFCELQTRVGIVDFVESEDIINICFESWYAMFKIVRNNLKKLQIPLRKKKEKKRLDDITNKSKNLDEVLFILLNSHMRPFLRKWHIEFNTYWQKNFTQDKNPIKVQKDFPNYSELIGDINILQNKLKEILIALEQIVRWGKKRYYLRKFWFYSKMLFVILIVASLIVLYVKFILPLINF